MLVREEVAESRLTIDLLHDQCLQRTLRGRFGLAHVDNRREAELLQHCKREAHEAQLPLQLPALQLALSLALPLALPLAL